MSNCFLEKDELIGHKVIEKRKGLFGKEVSLRGVYYNNLVKEIESCELDEISSDFLYSDIKYSLINRVQENVIKNLTLRNGGEIIGKTRLEKRINHLKFEFTNLYLNRALKILEENKEN